MSIKEIWGNLKYWQRGGIIGVIIGIIYFMIFILMRDLALLLILPILPIYAIFYVFFGDRASGDWYMLLGILLTFSLPGITFGQLYYQWKVSKFWSLKNWGLYLIAFLIIVLSIGLVLIWLLTS